MFRYISHTFADRIYMKFTRNCIVLTFLCLTTHYALGMGYPSPDKPTEQGEYAEEQQKIEELKTAQREVTEGLQQAEIEFANMQAIENDFSTKNSYFTQWQKTRLNQTLEDNVLDLFERNLAAKKHQVQENLKHWQQRKKALENNIKDYSIPQPEEKDHN